MTDHSGSDWRFISVAADAQGPEAARPWVSAAAATFPTYVDAGNELGRAFGYQAIPVGIFVNPGGTVAYVKMPFSIDETEDVAALEAFLAGRAPVAPAAQGLEGRAEAVETFAEGAALLARGEKQQALGRWRNALNVDPDSYIIRKQIWAVEHPERFYPAIDSGWQDEVLARERDGDRT